MLVKNRVRIGGRLNRVVALAFAGVIAASLIGCGQKTAPVKVANVSGYPDWVVQKPSVGAVCTQVRGVYSRSKAENLAINNCLLQLSDKKISGNSTVSKDVSVNKTMSGEQVSSHSQSSEQFIVTAAGKKTLSYDVRGKHYDRTTEKVYVWVVLK